MDPFEIKVIYNEYTDSGSLKKTTVVPGGLYKITFDDTVKEVKEKLFRYFGGGEGEDDEVDINSWMSFQKLSIKDPITKETIVLDGTRMIRGKVVKKSEENKVLTYFTTDGRIKDNTIYFESLIDTLAAKDINTPKEHLLFEKDYPNVTRLEFEAAIYSNKEQVSQNEYDSLISFYKKVKREAIVINKKLENLAKAYQSLKTDFRNNLRIANNFNNKLNFSIISMYIEFKSQTAEKELKGEKVTRDFLDFNILFNQLKVSKLVPFISYNPETGKVYTKVYDKLRQDPSTKDLVANWLITEKDTKRNKPAQFKNPQGLTFRILSGKHYILANLFKDGKVFIRASFTAEEYANEENIIVVINSFNKLVAEINKFKVAIKGSEKRLEKLEFKDLKFRSIDVQLNLNVSFSKDKLRKEVSKSHFKEIYTVETERKKKDQICEELIAMKKITKDACKKLKLVRLKQLAEENGINLKESSSSEQVILNYKRVSSEFRTVLTRYQNITAEEAFQKLTVSFKSQNNSDLGLIALRNVKNIFQIYQIFNVALSLVNLIKVEKGGRVLKKQNKLDLLKKYNIARDSRKCQKIRQPQVDINGDYLSEEQLRKNKSYSLTSTKTNGIRLVCTENTEANSRQKEQWLFPGYTDAGVPCCFKYDQRNTPQWKNHHSSGETLRGSLSTVNLKIKRVNVIKTDKVLLPGRLGLITNVIQDYFTHFGKPQYSNFVRFGVLQNDESFLNAIYELVNGTGGVTWNTISDFKKDLINYLNSHENIFKVLQNGNIAKQFKKKEYISFIVGNGTSLTNATTPINRNKASTSRASNRNSGGSNKNNRNSGGSNRNSGESTRSVTEENRITGGVSHKYLLDLLALFVQKNIFIFSEKSQNIVCYSDYSELSEILQKDKDCIFLIKKGNHYEPIIDVPKEGKVTRFFKKTDNIVKSIKKLYTLSCKGIPTKVSPITSALTTREFIIKLHNTVGEGLGKDFKIVSQVVNHNNKVIYVVLEYKNRSSLNNDTRKFLVPMKPTGPIQNYPITKNYKDYMHSAKTTKAFLDKLKNVCNDCKFEIQSQILEKYKTIALILRNGFAVPTIESNRLNVIISKINFSIDIEEFIQSGLKVNDHRIKLLSQININKGIYQQVRFELSSVLNNNTRNDIKDIILNTTTSDSYKRNALDKIIGPILKDLSINTIVEEPGRKSTGLCKGSSESVCSSNPYCKFYSGECKLRIPKEKFNYIKKRIIQELITDTIDQLIIKGLVTLEVSESDEFIKRPNETVLLDVSHAIAWLKGERVKYK